MTIWNLLSAICNTPGSMAILLLGLLPVPPSSQGLLGPPNSRDKYIPESSVPYLSSFCALWTGWDSRVPELIILTPRSGDCSPPCEGRLQTRWQTLPYTRWNPKPTWLKSEVPTKEFGSRANHHNARDYARYEHYECKTHPSILKLSTLLALATVMKPMVSRWVKKCLKNS